ncbi:MAG: tetratricopeptide repeat protein, partial [Pikeienuella sp.]
MRWLHALLLFLAMFAFAPAKADIFEKCAQGPDSVAACSQALSAVQRAMELNGETPDGIYLRGLLFVKTGEFENAIEDLTITIATQKHDDGMFRWRGEAYHRLGKLDLAVADYERATSLDPDDPYANLFKAAALIDLNNRAA